MSVAAGADTAATGTDRADGAAAERAGADTGLSARTFDGAGPLSVAHRATPTPSAAAAAQAIATAAQWAAPPGRAGAVWMILAIAPPAYLQV